MWQVRRAVAGLPFEAKLPSSCTYPQSTAVAPREVPAQAAQATVPVQVLMEVLKAKL